MYRLLKFGKREHLEQLAKGYLFFSPLEKFKILEIETSNKGRGDRNEGRFLVRNPKNIRLYKLKEDGSYESNPSFVIEKLDVLPINIPVLNNLRFLSFCSNMIIFFSTLNTKSATCFCSFKSGRFILNEFRLFVVSLVLVS